MARLDYNEDNFFGTEGRGTRYNIRVNGQLAYSDVCDSEVDYLCREIERQAYGEDWDIEVEEI